MERSLWNRIQEIYHLALPLPPSERRAYLAGACNNDQFVIREVESLLRAADAADGFLESPVVELGLNEDDASNLVVERSENVVGSTVDGRYFIESELDHGGMGKVYLARDIELYHRPVVIKVLLQASLDNLYMVTKFRQQVEALSRIDHPNVVNVVGAGELRDGKPYIAMQYVDGVTLRSQIPNEGMGLERAASILRQIGTALVNVHEKGIFHRDLKPENILLQSFTGGAELVKVVDFGIAKVRESVFGSTSADKPRIGTMLYMSPEQLRGGEEITAASDVYSMAVVAYEMITGRRPFNASSAPQLLEMQREGVRVNPIDLRPGLSAEARVILLRALSFEPDVRYQNAAEFGEQLARALTRRGPSPVPDEDRKRTVRILSYLLGGLFIVLGGVGTGIYLNNRVSTPQENQVAAVPQPSLPARSFNYWLDVQRMRNGKPYQEPFLSSGNENFETDEKFRLNVSSPDPGFLYLFNEGPPSPAGTSFTIVYPTPSTNEGAATLGANQLVRTNWNSFAGDAGTENFWIIWSASPVPELENAKATAFKHPEGGLTGENLVAIRKFLMSKQDEIKTQATTNSAIHQTTVRGNGDVLVRMVEFQHR